MTRKITTAADGVTTSEMTFEWDALDQLVAIKMGNGQWSEFSYDGLGRRVLVREYLYGGLHTEQAYVWDKLRIVRSGELWTGWFELENSYFDQGY